MFDCLSTYKLLCENDRMSKWFMRLSTYDLTYEPRIAIKSQALADFVADHILILA